MSAFLRFAAVGAAGFVVNEAALYTAIHLLGLGRDAAWFFAFVPAVTFTWWGNRRLTFAAQASREWMKEWGRFVATNALGAGVNLAVYETLIHLTRLDPALALAAGVLCGLAFNFTLSKWVVFRSYPPEQAGEED